MIFEDGAAPEVPKFAKLDAAPPAGLEGSYALGTGGRLVLRRIHGRLYVGAEGQDATDVLAGAKPTVEEERAWYSRAGLAAFEGALRRETAALEPLLGPQPNPVFAGMLMDELEREVRERGGFRRATLLGTFATGWPHGNPTSQETTLIRLECAAGELVEAIRWSGRVISWTEEVAMPLACCVPLQLAPDGSWVGWKLLEAQPLRLRTVETGGAPGIELELAGRTTRARRP
jgi:hypothetical protein